MLSATLFVAMFSISAVSGHGYVSQVTVNGTTYPGNAPGRYTVSSPIRTVIDDIPVTNVSDPQLNCGRGATNGIIDITVEPGSAVNFTWVSGSGGNWPHQVGPILTYMAFCDGATSCDGFNAIEAQWFKIGQVGKQTNGVGWVQQLIMQGYNFNVTIPDDLKSGGYLIRNELIGLQNAMAPGGAEFFPSCTQLRVVGNGTAVPEQNDTITFPGAYNASDPGILFDAYTDPNKTYIFPGPPLATFVNASSPTSNLTNTTSSATSLPSGEFAFLIGPMEYLAPVEHSTQSVEEWGLKQDSIDRRFHSRIRKRGMHWMWK